MSAPEQVAPAAPVAPVAHVAPVAPVAPEHFAPAAAAAPEGAAPAGAAEQIVGGARSDKRSFTVMSTNQKIAPGGTYISSTPLNAAKKAARQLFAKADRARKIHFVLREMTRGSAKKTYKYVATKKKLDKPKTLMRGDVKIVLKHEYEVKSDA